MIPLDKKKQLLVARILLDPTQLYLIQRPYDMPITGVKHFVPDMHAFSLMRTRLSVPLPTLRKRRNMQSTTLN